MNESWARAAGLAARLDDVYEKAIRGRQMNQGHLKVPDLMSKAIKLFEERAASYGPNYRRAAQIMMVLFPNGIHLKTEEDFLRFQLLEHIISKLTRYTTDWTKPHADSIFDQAVYTFMMAAADQERNNNGE